MDQAGRTDIDLTAAEFDRLDGLRVLFLDFDSFFASCEQQRDPDLREKPVGVIPVATRHTCCIAASYEAKRFGVKTGTPIAEAERLCPGIVFVLAEHRVYIEFQQRALEAIDRCAPVWGVHSIDELSIKLCPRTRERAAAVELGRAIKASLREHVGEAIRCTIGLASNRFLAKTACNLGKPDGLVVMDKPAVRERVLGLDAEKLTGIGPNMGRRLRARGIATGADLYRLTEKEMKAAWEGILGTMWWEQLRGGPDYYDRPTSRQSVGHQHIMPPELRTPEGTRAVGVRLLTKACVRLRDMRYHATRMSVSVRYERRPSWHVEARFEPLRDSMELQRIFARVWSPPALATAGPKQVSVCLHGLTPSSSVEEPLFEPARRRDGLSDTLDRITRRFGYDAVYAGSMHTAKRAAPRRIAFGNIPDLRIPDAETCSSDPGGGR